MFKRLFQLAIAFSEISAFNNYLVAAQTPFISNDDGDRNVSFSQECVRLMTHSLSISTGSCTGVLTWPQRWLASFYGLISWLMSEADRPMGSTFIWAAPSWSRYIFMGVNLHWQWTFMEVHLHGVHLHVGTVVVVQWYTSWASWEVHLHGGTPSWGTPSWAVHIHGGTPSWGNTYEAIQRHQKYNDFFKMQFWKVHTWSGFSTSQLISSF